MMIRHRSFCFRSVLATVWALGPWLACASGEDTGSVPGANSGGAHRDGAVGSDAGDGALREAASHDSDGDAPDSFGDAVHPPDDANDAGVVSRDSAPDAANVVDAGAILDVDAGSNR